MAQDITMIDRVEGFAWECFPKWSPLARDFSTTDIVGLFFVGFDGLADEASLLGLFGERTDASTDFQQHTTLNVATEKAEGVAGAVTSES